jgi:hypothetical protein
MTHEFVPRPEIYGWPACLVCGQDRDAGQHFNPTRSKETVMKFHPYTGAPTAEARPRNASEAVFTAQNDPSHLTAFEHFRLAEQYAAAAAHAFGSTDFNEDTLTHHREMALVHAKIAQVAVLALNDNEGGMKSAQLAVWRQTCELPA